VDTLSDANQRSVTLSPSLTTIEASDLVVKLKYYYPNVHN
jgi:hypothetical protein